MPATNDLNQQSSDDDSEMTAELPSEEPVSFPWMMAALAGGFDLVGLVPILNFFTESVAGLTFGLWQKTYAPKTNPLITFFIAKIIDAGTLGIAPSNIGIVVFAFMKKKADQKLKIKQPNIITE